MEALIYFAIWAGLIFVMMRFGCGAHIMGKGLGDAQTRAGPRDPDGAQLRWVPPARDTDPVCGRGLATEKAKPSVYAGHVYYFCSRDCREIFEAAPDQYVGTGEDTPKNLEHSHA